MLSGLYKTYRSTIFTHIFFVLATLLFASCCLAGCSGINLGGTGSTSATKGTTATATSAPQVALADLRWCGKPILIFRDGGATKSSTPTVTGTTTPAATPTAAGTSTVATTPTVSGTPIVAATPKTLTDWKQVESNLGFTVFLPSTLPQGSCLISASGTIHDATFGGIFTIAYVLPNHDAISLSEAPLTSQTSGFQCSPSGTTTTSKTSTPTPGPTAVPVQLCTGARNNTNIVLSARGTTSALEQTFTALQPNISWVPTT